MTSPFPGMDPYLEAPAIWPDVHHGLISELQAQLNKLLRPRYHVAVEERVYISDENDPGRSVFIPELRVTNNLGDPSDSRRRLSETTSGELVVAEPILLTTMIEDEIHEPRLEVIDSKKRIIVTVIEILSPANKIVGSRSRASYEAKRRDVMTSTTHFVEIDLLRNGSHLHSRELLPVADYYVQVSRTEIRPKGFVWPILLRQRLPVISIPLMSDDPDAKVDLQAILNSCYDRAGYDQRIDYAADPYPPLSEQNRQWLHELLRSRGLR